MRLLDRKRRPHTREVRTGESPLKGASSFEKSQPRPPRLAFLLLPLVSVVRMSPLIAPLRTAVALGAMRLVNGASRRLGQGAGTVAGGRVALLLQPRLVTHLLKGRSVVLVTGTNGKTTTTALTVAAMGQPVASNVTGSNMLAGVVAALAADRSHTAVLEVDESYLPLTLADSHLAESVTVMLLNLSRDQLDRVTEVRSIAALWSRALRDARPVTVVANVSDPLVAYAVAGLDRVVKVRVPTTWNSDALSCPLCTQALSFGDSDWSCHCGFTSPDEDVRLGRDISWNGSNFPLGLSLPGAFNAANATMAFATAVVVHAHDPAEVIAAMNAVTSVAGRFEIREWRGRRWRLMLAKNPAGIEALCREVDPSRLLVIDMNDGIADGRDPSWLYDAPFENLSTRTVVCMGSRRLDLATRLQYAGFEVLVTKNPVDFTRDGEVTDVIANYTAFADWMNRSQPC